MSTYINRYRINMIQPCTHTYNTFVHAFTHADTHNMFVCWHVCMHVYIINIHTGTDTRMHAYIMYRTGTNTFKLAYCLVSSCSSCLSYCRCMESWKRQLLRFYSSLCPGRQMMVCSIKDAEDGAQPLQSAAVILGVRTNWFCFNFDPSTA